MIEIFRDTKHEAAEIKRMRKAQADALLEHKSKAARDEARKQFPVSVWCPLREQFISCSTCARMQTQKRIIDKCFRSRCPSQDAAWSHKLTKERRKDDPKDKTLGYLLITQYMVANSDKKKKRKKKKA